MIVPYASRYLRITSPLMRGPDVAALQQRLKSLGYYSGQVNSVFDSATVEALKAFQTQAGLTPDGIAGPATWMALGFPEVPSIQGNKRIAIDVDEKTLVLRENNKIVRTYPVAVGRLETPTPLGNWVIIEKQENPGGPFGVRWMRLSVPWGGYGIHGTDNPNSIGTAASHGCVRMQNQDVIDLYSRVEIGTPVQIIGAAALGRLLQVGSSGPDVREVQQRLQFLGYFRGDVDGVFGPVTETAVKNFQKDNGLEPDGIVGPQTYDRLQKALDVALGVTQP